MSFWLDRPVVVTGGCGFIGSHLVERLIALGAHVRVLGLYNSASRRGFLDGLESPRLEVHLGDVADAGFTSRVLDGADTVFHLAALVGIPYSYAAPAQYVRVNVDGTLAVLEAARALPVRRIVHTSTSEIYGSAQYTPIDERHPVVAQSPYAATKAAADQLVGSYHRSFDLPVVTLRPFNTFGPRQSRRAVLPTLMAQALFGDRLHVGSLTPKRDMNFVSDTVGGFLGAAEATGVEGQVFNVGSGTARSVAQMVDAVLAVTGCTKPVTVDAERQRPPKSEVTELLCDYRRAHEAFGYRPMVPFETGLAELRDSMLATPLRDSARYVI